VDEKISKKVDEDWKERVAAEKAAPAAGVSPKEQPTDQPKAEPKPKDLPQEPKQTEFTFFISSLSMQALIALGEMPHPATNQPHPDPEQARYLVDLLGMLQEKTKGNLSAEETSLLENVLYELRMKYVAMLQAVQPPPPGPSSRGRA